MHLFSPVPCRPEGASHRSSGCSGHIAVAGAAVPSPGPLTVCRAEMSGARGKQREEAVPTRSGPWTWSQIQVHLRLPRVLLCACCPGSLGGWSVSPQHGMGEAGARSWAVATALATLLARRQEASGLSGVGSCTCPPPVVPGAQRSRWVSLAPCLPFAARYRSLCTRTVRLGVSPCEVRSCSQF